MNFFSEVLMVIAIGAAPLTAFAHDSNLVHQQIQLTEIPASAVGITADQLRSLNQDGHHSIEGEAEGAHAAPAGQSLRSKVTTRIKQLPGQVKQLPDKLKFKQMALNAYRWYSRHKGLPHVENAAANIVAMYITSHTIETVGGFSMMGHGVGSGMQGWTDWMTATVGGIIIWPTLDPLCIFLSFTYGKFPVAMNKALTVPRLIAVHLAKLPLSYSGVHDRYLAAAVQEKLKDRFLTELAKTNSSIKVTSSKLEAFEYSVFGAHGGQVVTLKMHTNANGGQALESISFSPDASAISRGYLEQLLTPFGLNIRNLVLEMDAALSDNKLNEMEHLPYVEHVNAIERTITVKPGAFPFHYFKESELPCQALLI